MINENARPVIPVFYACDNGFVKFTMVSIASILENASHDFFYEIHILHTDITEENADAVRRMTRERDNVRICFDDVSDYLRDLSGRLPLRDYYTKTTYFRLFIADMFPKYDKAIYIDSDTVALGDISELYAFDLGENLVGACHEQVMMQENVYGEYVEKCVGIPREKFFNAGVLLLNCRLFREEEVLSKFSELLSVYDFVVTQDEDYLNVICRDRVKFLPQGWNAEVFGVMCPENEIKILHYIMVSKPWHYGDCRYAPYFWRYADMTEVGGKIREILASYTDEERERDAESCERLMNLAIAETRRDDGFFSRMKRNNCTEDRQKILDRIDLYEYEGRFDEDVEDDPPGRMIMPGEVDYLGRKWRTRMFAKCSYVAAKRYLNSILKNGDLVVKEIKGSENLAALDTGAVLTCNHFNAMDSFAMQLAFMSAHKKNKKLYRVIREGNYTSFPGFFGFLMRHFYTLPLSSNFRTGIEFTRAVDSILRDGDFVLVYPEQSMWWNYRKPKPLKEGAFNFAAKNNLPVVPCFITMEDSDRIGSDGFPIQEYTIHIEKPIMPDPEKSVRANTREMLENNYNLWKDIYETTYNIPLTYNTKRAN